MKKYHLLIPLFLMMFTTGLSAQTSLFSVMGNYQPSFEFKPELRLTNHQDTRHLPGMGVILESQSAYLTWGGGFRIRYKCVDRYSEDVVDDQDSLTGQKVELKDQITFISLYGTASTALVNTVWMRIDLGVDLGLIAADRKFALGDGALNLQAPVELQPWLRIRLAPRNEFSPVIRLGYLLATPYTETRITEYTENTAATRSYTEKTRLNGPTVEAGFIYRF
ncbi:MAG TPA: hypothetical protein DEH00_09500 [Candidatus Marinimicrobia bacterium]|nr:hypothetical protein [Candidatus Neomarinimicrobiota bacterium]